MKKIFFLMVVIAFSCIAQVRAQAGTPPIRKADIGPARPRAVVSLPVKSSGGSVVAGKPPTAAPVRSSNPGGSGRTSQGSLFTKPGANSQGTPNAGSLPPSALPVRSGKDSLQKKGSQ